MPRLYSHPREYRKILLANYLCIGFVPAGNALPKLHRNKKAKLHKKYLAPKLLGTEDFGSSQNCYPRNHPKHIAWGVCLRVFRVDVLGRGCDEALFSEKRGFQ